MLRSATLLAVALLAPPLTSLARAGANDGVVELGDVPARTFHSPIWNGVLVRSLADLRGRPTLFEFWGTRCPLCVNGGVPGTLKMQESFGEDLQVVFVEMQGATPEGALAFALGRRWLGGRAMWTTEPPFFSGSSLLPSAVLLDRNGRVIFKGNPVAGHKEIERLVQDEIRLARSAPPGASAGMQAAWIELGKGRYAKAVEVATALAERASTPPEIAAEARAAIERFRREVSDRLARIQALVDAGAFAAADEALDDLRRGTHDDAELDREPAELASRLAAPAWAAERTAATALDRILTRFYDSGGDPAIAGELRAFARDHAGSRSAARALQHAELVLGTAR